MDYHTRLERSNLVGFRLYHCTNIYICPESGRAGIVAIICIQITIQIIVIILSLYGPARVKTRRTPPHGLGQGLGPHWRTAH